MINPVILTSNDEYYLPYCLELTRGLFDRYIIYSIGSEDSTNKILEWWRDTNTNCSMIIKLFPMLDPKIQGCFRNSMALEAFSEYYFILDADELYSRDSLQKIPIKAAKMKQNGFSYGKVRRIEIIGDLKQAHGTNDNVPHHRLYHLFTPWGGSHPGEYPLIPQKVENTGEYYDITCYHFHGTSRSSKDGIVPRRMERRNRATYRPGSLDNIDILTTLPILQKRIEDFPVSPELDQLQKDFAARQLTEEAQKLGEY